MGAEEKNRNEILSRIAAELFVKSRGGEELSSKIRRLRDELKKVIESEESLFGKFHGLVESFREIIPEEKQRYNAAIKALSTTAKASRQDIVQAVHDQLEEVKILEKGLLSTPLGWRDELQVMETRSREMRDEISKLREKIGRLESEEKDILTGMAAREKEMELISRAVGELFTEITAEITSINRKVAELTAEPAVSQPAPPHTVPPPVPSQPMPFQTVPPQPIPSQPMPFQTAPPPPVPSQPVPFQTVPPQPVPSQPVPPQAISPQTIPPGDSKKSDIPGQETGVSEQKIEIGDTSVPQFTEWQKNCPMCGVRMDSYMKMWRCFSCAYEELREERGGGEQKSEIRESSAPHEQQHTEWQKKCSMCGGRMDFYMHEKMWRCFSCAFEESEEGAVQDKSQEESEEMNAPDPGQSSEPHFEPSPSHAVPLASRSSDEYQAQKWSPPSNNQQSPKKKNCPVCRKKMQWIPMEHTWRCAFCDYERRI